MSHDLTERNFYAERLVERITELRQQHKDEATFQIELAKVMLATSQNESERMTAQMILGLVKALA